MPDLSELGMDVAATEPMILADDFECTTTGPITNIVVWGSWYRDALPFGGDPTMLMFFLSMHADIPTNASGQEYSMPGETLWTGMFDPGQFMVEPETPPGSLVEGWYDPSTGIYEPVGDWTCWRYTFDIDPSTAFVQIGSTNQPVVYWLDVQAIPMSTEPVFFGWKTSTDHWNDDAVWGQGSEPYAGPWSEMRYPDQHPMHPMSIDRNRSRGI